MADACKITAIAVFLLFALSVLSFCAEEQITITTFYPSPYGSYREIVANKMKIGTTYSAATVSIEDNDLIVEGNVGIGTTSPEYKLHLFDTGGSVALLEGGGTGSTNNVATLKLQDDVTGDNWSLSMRKTGASYPQARQLRLFFYDDSADTYDEYLRLMPDTDPTVVHFPGRVGIGTDTPQAALDISTTTSAFMPPRMTTAQRDNINSTKEGMVIYNTVTNNIETYDGSNWKTPAGEVDGGYYGYCETYSTGVTYLMPPAIIIRPGSSYLCSCPSGYTVFRPADGRRGGCTGSDCFGQAYVCLKGTLQTGQASTF